MATITLKDERSAKNGDEVVFGNIIYEDDLKVVINNGRYKETFLKVDILSLF